MYHCATTIIKIVRTKGKAGYLDWKSAGGQGDHEISRPWIFLGAFDFLVVEDAKFSLAKPLFIVLIKNLILY